MSEHDEPVPDLQPAAMVTSDGDPSGMGLSMHAGVDASCDCCSCEAEPYWVEAMAEPLPPAGRR